jgi:hypothetical protein
MAPLDARPKIEAAAARPCVLRPQTADLVPPIGGLTIPTYAALASLILNLIIVINLTPVCNPIYAVRGEDETRAEHYV